MTTVQTTLYHRIDEPNSRNDLADYHIAIVIPVFNESRHIKQVLESIPSYIRSIIVVDDGSTDDTLHRIEERMEIDSRIQCVQHRTNQGVGMAMMTGYRQAIELSASIVVKMDGDGQMSSESLPKLISPLLSGVADYSKGSRFAYTSDASEMPLVRRIGNVTLGFMTKVAAGYWNLLDPTNGFTAIRTDVLKLMRFERLDPKFFFETSMLSELYLLKAVVRDIPMAASYGNETSHLSPLKAMFQFPPRLLRRFLRRIFLRHVVYDFSIGAIYTLVGGPLGMFGLVFGILNWARYSSMNLGAPTGTVVIPALCILVSIQLILRAIDADIQSVPRIPINLGPLAQNRLHHHQLQL